MPRSTPARKSPGRSPKPKAPPRPSSPPRPARAQGRSPAKVDPPTTALARRTPEQVIPAHRTSVGYEKLLEDADDLANAAYASNTERAYTADFEDWKAFARSHSRSIKPPYMPITADQLRAYIADLAHRGLSMATIRRRCAALSKLHRISCMPSPTKDPLVLRALQGLARKRTVRQTKKDAFRLHHLMALLRNRTTKLRDRVVLLVGLLTGMRRSELVAFRWNELRKTAAGIQIEIAESKTDQEGVGAIVPLLKVEGVPEVCPVTALDRWREHCKPKPDDPVFPISDRTVARAVKRAVRLSGEDPKSFGGHSLRAGFMTLCDELGVSIHDAMGISRHLTRAVAEGYVRGQTIMKNPAAVALARALGEAGTKAAPSQPSPSLLRSGKKARRSDVRA